ncbi:MAG: nucleoside hydrolase [Prolixibacteraceae bacterium]|jgi:purine nucleosidase|nr:nucleoside hydrolase [Prolixibacteraceae bacterium]
MQLNLTNTLQKPVILDHDGSVDDFVALITMLTLSKYKLIGITVTGGNCILSSAVDTTAQILSLFCRYDVEVCKSNAEPVNPFPSEWQEKNHFTSRVPLLLEQKTDDVRVADEDAVDFMARKIENEDEKVTIILTGPSTNIAHLLKRHPEIGSKIEKVLWMGGAFLSDGNVVYPDHDGSAEWNVFWDPVSALALLEAKVQKLMFPLDISYMLPVDDYLMFCLEKQKEYKLSALVYDLFKPDFDVKAKYYMYDVLPVVFLGAFELFRFESKAINIEQRGTSKGNIYRSSQGFSVKQAKWVAEDQFYDFFLNQLTLF